MSVYTVGVWRAKEGSAEAFREAWTALARRTKAEFPGAGDGTATLLQDASDPNLFVSYGPWPSADVIAEWRNSAIFTEGVAAIRELVESFTPHTMNPAAVV